MQHLWRSLQKQHWLENTQWSSSWTKKSLFFSIGNVRKLELQEQLKLIAEINGGKMKIIQQTNQPIQVRNKNRDLKELD